jgi:hypothetical protein
MADDGASSLAADSRFFDRLVDLVPARHYLATADGGGAAVAAKFLKRAEREAAKAASRAHRKVAKRSKLNGGDGERSTLELQRAAAEKAAAGDGSSGSEEESGSEEDSDDEDDTGARGPAPSAAAGAAVPRAAGQLSLAAVAAPATKADLRARLAARIEALRAGRKAAESAEKVERAKGWRDARLERGRKEAAKKRTLAALAPAHAPRGGAERKERGGGGARPAGGGGARPAAAAAPRPDSGGGLSFNRLDFGDDARGPRGRSAGRKASKPELLAAAEAKRAAGAGTAAAHGGPPAPGAEAREAWAAAMERARGNKVLDDPKLLRKSIKREAKGKAKSAAAWKERASKQRAEVGAKQDRRRANLQGRVDAKVEAKKAKREKRLLRAGFEGRRRGPIGTPSPGGAAKGGK